MGGGDGGRDRSRQRKRRCCADRKERGAHSTHMGVQREVEVSPELLDGAATPVFKYMQVGAAPELYRRRSR